MSKKYVIEIKSEYEDTIRGIMILGARDSNLYMDALAVENLEELNSDYINEHFGDLQDTAYQKGLEDGKQTAVGAAELREKLEYQKGLDDAWECAKKLFSTMSDTEIEKVFPTEWENGFYGLMQMKPQEAIAKLKAYEEKQDNKFEFGDEITNSYGTKGCVVSKDNEEGEMIYALFDGYRVPQHVAKSKYRKTGKHYDIEKILEALKA